MPGDLEAARDAQVPLESLMPNIIVRLGPEKFDDGVPLF